MLALPPVGEKNVTGLRVPSCTYKPSSHDLSGSSPLCGENYVVLRHTFLVNGEGVIINTLQGRTKVPLDLSALKEEGWLHG